MWDRAVENGMQTKNNLLLLLLYNQNVTDHCVGQSSSADKNHLFLLLLYNRSLTVRCAGQSNSADKT